jgi:hypothetical protein
MQKIEINLKELIQTNSLTYKWADTIGGTEVGPFNQETGSGD